MVFCEFRGSSRVVRIRPIFLSKSLNLSGICLILSLRVIGPFRVVFRFESRVAHHFFLKTCSHVSSRRLCLQRPGGKFEQRDGRLVP